MPAVAAKTSLVITCFNDARHLGELRRALALLDPAPEELVVVDDASTDGTSEAIHDLCPDGVRRFAVRVHETNRGTAAARNTGLEQCEGRFVAFLDGDDLPLPWRIGAPVAMLQERGGELGAAVGRALEFREGRVLIPKGAWRLRLRDVNHELLRSNPVYFSTLTIDREIVRGRFDESIRHHEDYEFLLQARSTTRIGVVWPRPLLLYRLSPSGKSSDQTDRADSLAAISDLHPEVEWADNQELRELPRRILRARAAGNTRAMVAETVRAAVRSPRILFDLRWQILDRIARDPRGYRFGRAYLADMEPEA